MVSASEAMSDVGYTSQIIPMSHDDHGGCTIRQRAYLVSVHAEACGVSQAAAVDIVAKIVAKAKQTRKQNNKEKRRRQRQGERAEASKQGFP